MQLVYNPPSSSVSHSQKYYTDICFFLGETGDTELVLQTTEMSELKIWRFFSPVQFLRYMYTQISTSTKCNENKLTVSGDND